MRNSVPGTDDRGAAGPRRQRLAVEIAAALAVKFVLLFAIWATWFSHPARPDLDARSVAAAVLGAGHGPPVRNETRE